MARRSGEEKPVDLMAIGVRRVHGFGLEERVGVSLGSVWRNRQLHCNETLIVDDTESAKAARRQLKQTIYSILFDMNVPATCAINQERHFNGVSRRMLVINYENRSWILVVDVLVFYGPRDLDTFCY